MRLIHEYIGRLTQEKCQKKDEASTVEAEKEIDCLLRFSAWSMDPSPPPMDYHMKRYPMPSEYDVSGPIFPEAFLNQRGRKAEEMHGQMTKGSVIQEVPSQ